MAGYIGSKASVVSSGVERKKIYDITTTTTSLTGLNYSSGQVHVFHNGVRLVDGTDYTATNGTSITLTTAAESGDQVVVVSYASYQVSDTVSASVGGTFAGDVSVTGAFTSLGIDDNAASTAVTIAASGNVGIGGATLASDKLTVSQDQSDTTWSTGSHVFLKTPVATDTTGFTGISYATSSLANYGWSVGALRSAAGASSYVFNYHESNDAGSERMRIDASGNVGIGTAVPSYPLDVTGTIRTTANFQLTANDSYLGFSANGMFAHNANDLVYFKTGAVERMRIDPFGRLFVGTTVAGGDGITGYVRASAGQTTSSFHFNRANTSSSGTVLAFKNNGTIVGSVSHTNTNTTYTTSSDYRLKENITPVQGAADIVKAMRPVTYNFKANSTDWHDGFLAHELQELHPRAVIGSKDAMMDEEYEVTPAVEATFDAEGNELTPAVPAVMGTRSVPDYQGVDYSKLTPILTAALKEALNKIEVLEAQNATFETRLAALEATP